MFIGSSATDAVSGSVSRKLTVWAIVSGFMRSTGAGLGVTPYLDVIGKAVLTIG